MTSKYSIKTDKCIIIKKTCKCKKKKNVTIVLEIIKNYILK